MPAETDLALARALGEHAQAGFLIALAVLLAVVVLVRAALARWVVPSETGRLSPLAFLLLRAGLGFMLVVVAALLFAELAMGLGVDRAQGRLDEAFAVALRASVSSATLSGFAVVTHLGDTATLTVLGVGGALALLVCGQRGLAVAWSVALAGNALLNVTLKSVFERVRPIHEGGLIVADGWSFPSGHASGAVVAYGMLGYLAIRLLPARWHLPLLMLATSAAFATGCSRVFLQVHHASDVLAGFASGTTWLAVTIFSAELMRRYRFRRG